MNSLEYYSKKKTAEHSTFPDAKHSHKYIQTMNIINAFLKNALCFVRFIILRCAVVKTTFYYCGASSNRFALYAIQYGKLKKKSKREANKRRSLPKTKFQSDDNQEKKKKQRKEKKIQLNMRFYLQMEAFKQKNIKRKENDIKMRCFKRRVLNEISLDHNSNLLLNKRIYLKRIEGNFE